MKPVVVFAILTVCAGASPLQHVPSKATGVASPFAGQPEAAKAGAWLYQQHCAACHGRDAKGRERVPPLVSSNVKEASAGAVYWVLRNGGLEHGMPSFAGLPEQRLWQIVEYLLTAQK